MRAAEDYGLNPVMVIGIDSASWEQIDAMIENGELENLEYLKSEGSWGVLRSEAPLVSPRLWSTMATGLPPEKHGIVDFYSTRFDLKAGRVWDAVAAAGGKVGLMEWHMTWPPNPYPGFCVPAWLAQSFATVPPEASFLKRLEFTGKRGKSEASRSFFRFELFQDLLSSVATSSAGNTWANFLDGLAILKQRNRQETYWRAKLIQMRMAGDLFLRLMTRESPVFSAMVLYPVDALGHLYWKYHEPEAFPELTEGEIRQFGEVVRNAYREADLILGNILKQIDLNEVTLVLVSDHGMEATPAGQDRAAYLPKADLILKTIGLEKQLRYAIAERQLIFSVKFPGLEGMARLRQAHQIFSDAFVVEKPDIPPFIPQPIEEEQGMFILELNYDTTLDPTMHISLDGKETLISDLFRYEGKSGMHHDRGILLMAGPGVKKNQEMKEHSIYDVAPTLLYSLGLKIPETLPGKVVQAAFRPSIFESRPIERTSDLLPPPPEVEIQFGNEQLRDQMLNELGYTDQAEEEEENFTGD